MKTDFKILNILITLLFLSQTLIYCSSSFNKTENVKIISSRVLTGCISGNCENGYGKFIYSDGIEYLGFWKDSKREGYGTLTITNGPISISQENDSTKNISSNKNYSTPNSDKKNHIKEITAKEKNFNAIDTTIMAMYGIKKVAESVEYVKEQNDIQKRKEKKSLCDVKYDGYWKNNNRHGQGQMINSDCSIIKGIWDSDILKK